MTGRRWSGIEIARLRELAPTTSWARLVEEFPGRTLSAIRQTIVHLNLAPLGRKPFADPSGKTFLDYTFPPKCRRRRWRKCINCGKSENIRADNASERCDHCSRAASLAKGRKIRYAITPKCMADCPQCGKTFAPGGKANPAQFCSMACFREAKGVERQCGQCSKMFRIRRSILDGRTNASGNFCSLPCYHASMRVEGKLFDRGDDWRRIRREALRLNPFCAFCGRLLHLHVHHLIPYRLTKDNRQINLAPLCRKHHIQFERISLSLLDTSLSHDEILWFLRYDINTAQLMTRHIIASIIKDMEHGEKAEA